VRGEEIAYFKENSVKSVHFLQEQERRKKRQKSVFGRNRLVEETLGRNVTIKAHELRTIEENGSNLRRKNCKVVQRN
jgi:hypothetical protein